MARNQQQGQRQRPEFSPGLFLADGLGELVENQIEQMEGLGLSVIGITAVLRALHQIGLDNPKAIGGLDMTIKSTIRLIVSDAALREFLIQVSDAYWDKVKILAEDASPDEVKRARSHGLENARAKIKSMIDKKTAKMPFPAIEAKLPPLIRVQWFYWVESLDARGSERLEAVKPLIEGPERIVYAMSFPSDVRLEYLERSLKGAPGLLETLKDAALGRDTPWTRDARARVKKAKKKTKKIAKEQGRKADAIRDAHPIGDGEKFVRPILAAVFVIGMVVVMVIATYI